MSQTALKNRVLLIFQNDFDTSYFNKFYTTEDKDNHESINFLLSWISKKILDILLFPSKCYFIARFKVDECD